MDWKPNVDLMEEHICYNCGTEYDPEIEIWCPCCGLSHDDPWLLYVQRCDAAEEIIDEL